MIAAMKHLIVRPAILAVLLVASHVCYASDQLDMTITAHILTDKCVIELDSALVILPTILNSTLDAETLTPTDYGSDAEFNIHVTECEGDDHLSALHFSLQPSSGGFLTGFNQVFANDLPPASHGAEGVGVVIFYHDSQDNVLKSDGSSDVIIPTTQGDYRKAYQFDVRYQKIGAVSAGMVTSGVIINVEYQ